MARDFDNLKRRKKRTEDGAESSSSGSESDSEEEDNICCANLLYVIEGDANFKVHKSIRRTQRKHSREAAAAAQSAEGQQQGQQQQERRQQREGTTSSSSDSEEEFEAELEAELAAELEAEEAEAKLEWDDLMSPLSTSQDKDAGDKVRWDEMEVKESHALYSTERLAALGFDATHRMTAPACRPNANLLSTGETVHYVLVYELPQGVNFFTLRQAARAHEAGNYEGEVPMRHVKRALKRAYFEHHLATNWEFVIERELAPDGITVFVKLHVPFHILQKRADYLQFSMPLKREMIPKLHLKSLRPHRDWRRTIKSIPYLSFLACCFPPLSKEAKEREMKKRQSNFATPFKYRRREVFVDWDNEHKFFTEAQRASIVLDILRNTEYSAHQNSQSSRIGIERLEHSATYIDSFALHDSAVDVHNEPSQRSGKTLRASLRNRWGCFMAMFRTQPLDDIRDYFGEKIALYFAWLGFYTSWLVLPSIVGILVFIYGIAQAFNGRTDTRELCDTPRTMCALCDGCEKWILSDSCSAYEWSYVFDNEATIFFACFMAIWATLFLDFWKRKNAVLANTWNMTDLADVEPPRGEFKGIGNRVVRNPITLRPEKWYPPILRKLKYPLSLGTINLMMAVVLIILVGTIVYRLAVSTTLLKRSTHDTLSANASAISSASAAVLNLIAILILDFFYSYVAVWLTTWENHKTASAYETHLTFKIVIFQFVNSYSSLFFIAFFKQRDNGVPGNYNMLFGFRADTCPAYGCLLELTIQLCIIMVGKQILNNVLEVFVPQIKVWFTKCCRRAKNASNLFPWNDDYQNLVDYPSLGLFSEYLEMFMQFGFITLFVSAFPLAPLFALFNNILEIRVDATKLTTIYRRPPGSRAENIGLWQFALEGIGLLSVITNGLVIAFTSDYIDKIVYRNNNGGSLEGYIDTITPFSPLNATTANGDVNQYNCSYIGLRDDEGNKTALFYEVGMAKLTFFIAFEHAVFLTKFIVATIVPDVPKWLVQERKREVYAARKAIEDSYNGHDTSAAAAAANNNEPTTSSSAPAAAAESNGDIHRHHHTREIDLDDNSTNASERFVSLPASPVVERAVTASEVEPAVLEESPGERKAMRGDHMFLPPGRSEFALMETKSAAVTAAAVGAPPGDAGYIVVDPSLVNGLAHTKEATM